MDDEIEAMTVRVRADTQGFARDVETMRQGLEGPLASGAERAGRAIEGALTRALLTGKFGFDDLRRVALSVMADIASAAIRSGIGSLFGGGGRTGGGGDGLLGAIVCLLGGAPGRATGGLVAPGAAYWVGERGPELFVPTASGRIAAVPGEAPGQGGTVMRPGKAAAFGGTVAASGAATRSGGTVMTPGAVPSAPPPAPPLPLLPPREVRVAITINAARGEAPAALAQSSRQIARAVRSALMEID